MLFSRSKNRERIKPRQNNRQVGLDIGGDKIDCRAGAVEKQLIAGPRLQPYQGKKKKEQDDPSQIRQYGQGAAEGQGLEIVFEIKNKERGDEQNRSQAGELFFRGKIRLGTSQWVALEQCASKTVQSEQHQDEQGQSVLGSELGMRRCFRTGKNKYYR